MKLCAFHPLMILLLLAASAWAADSTTQPATPSPTTQTWDSEFSNTLYNTPKGWSATQKSGTRMLIPSDLIPGEQAAIVITPGGELTGDFAEAFDQLRTELRGATKAKQTEVQ